MLAACAFRSPRVCLCIVLLALVSWSARVWGAETERVFRAGAAAIDIAPRELPVHIAGSFFAQTADTIQDRLHARCLVLDDEVTRVAILTVDTCVATQDLLDEAKLLAHQATGIPVDRMLMSATHTHAAPTLTSLLGSGENPGYRRWLPAQIAQAVTEATANLAPARIGWTVVRAPEHTHCRRWIRRPDRIDTDPFGRLSVRAMMHPGYQNPDYLGPAGPVDPDLSIVSVQSPEGRPIGLLANYSMHYVGAPPVSADYFGSFADQLTTLVNVQNAEPPFVALMSNGTSGDLHWMDYGEAKPAQPQSHIAYAEVIARKVFQACKDIAYHNWVPLAMRETTLPLRVRPICADDLTNARELTATFADRLPRTLPELYAREQIQLSQVPPEREVPLQALRIGELGIAAVSCEVFGLTGLQIKALSPLAPTFTIELANGYHGYIPPPAQHALGGYTTWRARSACLEVEAAPKVVEAVIHLLETVSGQPRRTLTGDDYPLGDYPRAVLASKPAAYWRFNEFEGPRATDESGNRHDGVFNPGIAFYLEGPSARGNANVHRINRAPHFAGGSVNAHITGLNDTYSVEMWFKDYLPADARPVTGYLFSRGPAGVQGAPGDHLGIGGTATGQGRLLFYNGDALKMTLVGDTEIPAKAWHHVAMVRAGRQVTVYLNGSMLAEIEGQAEASYPPATEQVFIGGRNDGFANFEGRIDEVAIYDRPLSADEITKHHAAAGAVEP